MLLLSGTTPLVPIPIVALSFLLPLSLALTTAHHARQDQLFYHLGCYSGQYADRRSLTGPAFASDTMTIPLCAAFCSRNRYFGLEFSRECYCGDVQTAPRAPDTDCAMSCAGDPSTRCGGPDRQDLYINLVYSPRVPATLSVPYIGCFVDGVDGKRVLPDSMLGADGMTAQKCQENCKGYRYFGVEFGRECWCGRGRPTVTAPETECSMGCGGDDGQVCGGSGRVNVWGEFGKPPEEVAGFRYRGCYTDSADRRVLSGKDASKQGMTIEMCAEICKGFGVFGVEYGTQCFCGKELGSWAERRPEGECGMRCSGDPSNVCGDANRMNVFSTP